jgi:hypothetical protein
VLTIEAPAQGLALTYTPSKPRRYSGRRGLFVGIYRLGLFGRLPCAAGNTSAPYSSTNDTDVVAFDLYNSTHKHEMAEGRPFSGVGDAAREKFHS